MNEVITVQKLQECYHFQYYHIMHTWQLWLNHSCLLLAVWCTKTYIDFHLTVESVIE